MYHAWFAQASKHLHQLPTWFDRAVAHATEKKFDPNLYLGFRLSPDQFALSKQIQTTLDTVKLAASRLTGKDAPKHEDTETTFDELRPRVASVIGYLGGMSAGDYEGAATRVISQPRWQGKVMSGENYFLEHAVPNFYFHLSHTYAILRHNGVTLGKKDYLGPLTMTAPVG